ncbi:anhydro-N-acetylmuramic acid kinase [Pontibacter sp. JAM-7]|uniref:anhydro-N-acetylmuramic acid kinase n=1 Tax=Pontibacter sp. JAM-7 TaxID=3366581 RepID=UPI003AF5789E
MNPQADLYIGLMSGTSVDGIDAALVQFEPSFKLLATHSCAFPSDIHAEILALCLSGANEIDRMAQLDLRIADCFAQAAAPLISKRASHQTIRAIGSHGQTIRHRPELGFSLQIGEPSRIAEKSGITTVGHFRQRDLSAGGQGAPLVPAFHAALFSKPGQERFILNLGGMANITHLPGRTDQSVTGFDTGPGNVLLDSWTLQHLQQPFDRNGDWAATGKAIPPLLTIMLSEPYFSAPAPKSTGREQFNTGWLEQAQARADLTDARAEDIQATLLQLTAQTACDAIQSQALSNQYEVFVCGGGAHNRTLMQAIREQLPAQRVSSTMSLGLDPDWVEAVAFAWLAWRCINKQSGNIPEVTGAAGNRILGAIYPV